MNPSKRSLENDAGRRRRRLSPSRSSSAIPAMVIYVLILFVAPNWKTPYNNKLFVSAFRSNPYETHHRATKQNPLSRKQAPKALFLSNKEDVSSQGLSMHSVAEGSPPRSIRVERMPRLPVWPVWAGVIDFFVGWVFGPEAGSKLEQYVLGGRVCPMQLDGKSTSPFLLLVHHHHNFWKWDAIFRKISALVLPEGFPAHPHRGFTTLTYFLDDKGGGGGFVHRDSIGVKQTYGAKGSYQNQAQWLFTGSGMLHEEMFDFFQNDLGKANPKNYNPNYELYQLWINVPGRHKLDPPEVQLLREIEGTGNGNENVDTMPRVVSDKTIVSDGQELTTHSEVVVIAGSYRPCEDPLGDEGLHFHSQAAPLHSDLSVLHVKIEETAKTAANSQKSSTPGWIYDIPSDHDTLIVYLRKGSCTMETTSASSRSLSTDVPIHSTVFIEKESPGPAGAREQLIVRPKELDDPLDLLILSGKPLYQDGDVVEPVAMQGSMVMNNNAQIQQAYTDYQYGKMGVPWDHELGDDEWMEHVRQTKPRMTSEIASTMQNYDKRNP